MNIFISYSRDDKQYVYALADRLRDDGNHYIWIDKAGLVGGASWWDEILKGIEKQECVIVVLTPRSLGSIYCQAELNYAQWLGKPILPLMLKQVDVPAHLSSVQVENISEISLDRACVKCERALGYVALRRERGEFKEKAPRPEDRPTVPVLEPGTPSEHVFEIYANAIEAIEKDSTLAKKLLAQVILADPGGLGISAQERLIEIDLEQDRQKAYIAIARLAANPMLKRDAVRAWKAYIITYGTDHDPNGYARTLSDSPPVVVVPPPPAAPRSFRAGDRLTDPLGIPMAYVPAGEFLMGSTQQQVNEAFEQGKKEYAETQLEWYNIEMPQHRQSVAAPFWLDLTPVTNSEYARFTEAGGYRNAAYWTEPGWAWAQQENKTGAVAYDGFLEPQQPRVGVTWFEAYAYCQWRGGRLPTEAEWEWAARGPENRIYPWGSAFVAANVIYGRKNGNTTAVVGEGIRKAGASWVGALDMSGNVWDWCSTLYEPYPYAFDDKRASIQDGNRTHVLRGGSWVVSSSLLRAAYRSGVTPDDEINSVGFRCVRSL